jgi:hypothetical protein
LWPTRSPLASFGSDYRVSFEVQEERERIVTIVAIGLKVREKVMIGGVEVNLR